MAKGSRALANVIVFFAGINSADQKHASAWINNIGGRTTSNMNSHVTHVVCSDAAWNSDNHKGLEKAFDEDEKRDKSTAIKFVAYQWIEDCATDRSKKSEGPYLCARLYSSKKRGSAAGPKANGKAPREPKAHKGMVTDMIAEQTEKHLDERSRKGIEDAIRQKEKREKIEEAARRQEERAQRKQTADAFQRGAKKARNEIFSENHHIYVDETGFKHDVSLTKVDPRLNRNERYSITIQIYESNAEPHTYATNLHFAGTAHLAKNNLLAAMGANFHTAFRCFKMAFKQYTKVEWDDRIIHSVKRAETAKNARTKSAGSDAESRPGLPVESEFVRQSLKPKPFDEMPYEYHPPGSGPRGLLPKEKQEELNKMTPRNDPRKDSRRLGSEKVEAWMSGANGAGPEDDLNNHASTPTEHGLRNEVIDLDEDQAPPSAPYHDGGLATTDGDYDFGEVPTNGMGQEEFENLLTGTWDAEHDFGAFLEPYGQPKGATGEDMPDNAAFEESINNFYNANHNEPNGALFGTHNAQDSDVTLTPGLTAEVDQTASIDAMQFDSFNHPTSTVPETTSFQPGTQGPRESMRADQVCGEIEEIMDNDALMGETKRAGVDEAAIVAEEPSIADEQAPNTTEVASATEEFPAKKLNLGSFLLGKRKAHEVLADEIAGDGAEKKVKGNE